MRIHAFLYAIHPWLTWPGFLSLLVAVLAAAAIGLAARLCGRPLGDPRWLGVLIGCGIAGVMGLALLQFACAALYLVFPSYLDWVEPSAAAVSWLVLHGSPAYPPIGSGDLYAQVYGPLLFQVTGLFLGALAPTIAVSKIPALCAFAAAHVLTYLALRRCGGSVCEALTLTAAQCVIQAGFTNQSSAFGVRADPWLFLMSAACTLVAVSRPSLVAAAVFGALTALAANFKLHAVLYEVPLALFVLCQDGAASARARMVAAGLIGFAVVFALPFLGADPANYLAILEQSSHRPLDRWLLEKNILMIGLLFLPILWIYGFHRPHLPPPLWAFFAATAACVLAILYPASKDGAGPYHFLPLLPSLAWGFLMAYHAARAQRARFVPALALETSGGVLLLAVVLGYGPIDAQAWDFVLNEYGKTPGFKTAIATIDTILDRHSGLAAAIGPGRNPELDLASLRVIPVFRGNPLPIDPVTWSNDGGTDGRVRDALALTMFHDCRVGLWLLPRGEAFVSSIGETMFAGAVLRGFRASYEMNQSGPLFDLWQCNTKPGIDRETEAR